MANEIEQITDYLFKCDYFSDDFNDDLDNDFSPHLDQADFQIKTYHWFNVHESWKKHLFKKCKTPEQIYNFINLYTYYGGIDYSIPDPYDLLGYIYAKINYEENWEKYGDFLDQFTCSILEKCDLVDLVKDPYYNPLKDSKLIRKINKYKIK